MGRGAGQQQGGQPTPPGMAGPGQGAGYNNPNAGGVGGQIPRLGGYSPEEMVGAYRSMGRSFGGLPGRGYRPQQAATRFAPGANTMNPEALPITASSGPASTQTSPVAQTQSGISPPSPASGFTGANPVGQTGGVPAEQPREQKAGNHSGRGPGQSELLTQALRFG